jgi:hypothetical protein
MLDSRAVSALVLPCLEPALKAVATVAVPSDAEALRSSLEEVGVVVVRHASVVEQHMHVPAPFTQESLVVL